MDGEDDVKIVEDAERGEASEDPERDADGLEAAEGKVQKLREELKVCRREKQEYMDGWQRAKADYVNALKRFETDLKTSELRGKVKAIETLLPAYDALERAKEHVPSEASAKEGEEVINGFLAVARQLETAFTALGLEEIGTIGEKFDPTIHDAFGRDPADSIETDNTVTVVLEKGWRMRPSPDSGSSIVIRPAKVRIAHFGG